jgi:type IV pilus assembly protein PilQ
LRPQAIAKLEPLRTQSFQLNYAKAADMVVQLTTSSSAGGGGSSQARFLSQRGSDRRAAHQPAVRDRHPRKLEECSQLLPSWTCRCARC